MKLWVRAPLGKHADVRARIGWRGLSSSEYRTDGPYLIAGQHIRKGRVVWDEYDHISDDRYDESPEIALRRGDVIISKDGTIGRVARIDDLPSRATLNGTMMLVRPKRSLDYRFLFHLLGGYSFQKLIEDKVSGSSIPHIFQRDMIGLEVDLPVVPEQSRIAAVLDTVDKAIAKTAARIAKLKQVRAGLLHDLLTRGLDDDGQLRDPTAHPEQFQESPVGRIPGAWRVSLARDLCSIITKGTTPPAAAFSTAARSVRYLRVDNLTFTGDLDLSPAPLFVERVIHENLLGRSIVVEGDVLMNIVGPPLGKVSVVPAADHAWNVNQAIAVFRVASDVSPYYLSRWLLSPGAQTWFRRESKRTSGQLNLTLEMCGNLPVPVPDASEAARMVELLRAIDTEHASEDAYLGKLGALKSGLTVDLLTGRVRVPESLFPVESSTQ